ncbi:peptidase M24, structural domain-containing protein [Spinellus fusiger]|nr:peptidase M24, structural domain-containing protein [Spinellus fusiger]
MPTLTADRLQALRALMKSEAYAVDAYYVPSEDAHISEYIASCDKRREWISGFSGSAGTAIVTHESACLFTDGRYFLQAETQLDSNWTLMKQGLPNIPTWREFLVNLPEGSRIGVDPTLISAPEASQLGEELKAKGSCWVPIHTNLVDAAWGKDRPSPPKDLVFVHPIQFAGKSHQEKLRDLQTHINNKHAFGVIVSALDEIAWLFNLRGSDIECNPVFMSYALVTRTAATLYVDEAKLTEDVRQHLDGIHVKPYASVFDDLNQLSKELSDTNVLLVNPKTTLAVEVAVGTNVREEASFITQQKAIKNEAEQQGFRNCHVRDGAALTRYFAWLEQQLKEGVSLDEVDAADRLEKFRSVQDLYVGLSFDTISSTGSNGAIIHYKPEKPTCKTIDPKEIYLCDSGAQYRDGTTDVTRTYHFGQPTAFEKRCFTRVLQGHIAIDTAVFPKGTTGYLLDPLARAALWKDGLNYLHGTGHGVGSFLNVHEGPHGIGIHISYNRIPLAAGMTVSNEPGYYEDGKFGIRIENIIMVKEANTPHNFQNFGFLGFETLTFVPMGLNLIENDLLSPDEKNWLNAYHKQCFEKLSPLVADDALATQWLKRETTPI